MARPEKEAFLHLLVQYSTGMFLTTFWTLSENFLGHILIIWVLSGKPMMKGILQAVLAATAIILGKVETFCFRYE